MNNDNLDPSAASTTVTTGGFRGMLRTRRHIAWAILGSVAVLGLLGWGGYVIYRQINPPVPQFNTESFDPERIPQDYAIMTDEELAYSVYHKIGITADELKIKQLDDRLLDTFEKAHIAGQALHGMDDQRERAYVAYGIAAAQAPQEVSYEFYKSYAEVALLAGKPQEAIGLLQKAKQAVQGSDASNETKRFTNEELDEQIYFIERNVL